MKDFDADIGIKRVISVLAVGVNSSEEYA